LVVLRLFVFELGARAGQLSDRPAETRTDGRTGKTRIAAYTKTSANNAEHEMETSAEVGSSFKSRTPHSAAVTAATDDEAVVVIRPTGEAKLLLLFLGRRRRLGACDRDDLVINILTRGRDLPSATSKQIVLN